MLTAIDGQALISVNKALITRASAVIPAVPLYTALLYRVMKDKNLHEGCIQQMYRLYHDFLFSGNAPKVDAEGRIRIDDWEMRPDVQREVAAHWKRNKSGKYWRAGRHSGIKRRISAASRIRHAGGRLFTGCAAGYILNPG